MTDSTPVGDEEVVLRHVPGGTPWQGSPARPRVTSGNFKLQPERGEIGLSVSRSPPTTPAELVARVGSLATGSRVAWAKVGEIRRFGLDVVAVVIRDDLGHAEIRSARLPVDEQEARRHLADLFRFLPPDPPPAGNEAGGEQPPPA